MVLSLKQTIYLKCLIDIGILQSHEDFEYPCYLAIDSEDNLSKEDTEFLEENDLIFWYDGYHITDKGIAAYHENKHQLPYHKKYHKG